MSHTSTATQLTDTENLAHDLAEAAGRCQATGLDPAITRSLLVAVVLLDERPKRGLAWANDVELVAEMEDQTERTSRKLRAIDMCQKLTQAEHDQAERELAAAQGALRAAKTSNDRAAAQARIDKAAANIADCLEALEILADGGEKLRAVLARLLAVPDELGDTYEAAYETVGRGHRLPYDGRFLGAGA